jgi:eukaryotic-like serine/threonine-protein kinase
MANYAYCKKDKTVEVGGYPSGASPYGALDMMGNVWEWVADWYDDGPYYSSSPERNPTGASSGYCRVLRGGSWGFDAAHVRASTRYRDGSCIQMYLFNFIGFRCVGD